jgi:hypothetical protein
MEVLLPSTPDRRALARDEAGLAELHDFGTARRWLSSAIPDRVWALGGVSVLLLDWEFPGRETAA